MRHDVLAYMPSNHRLERIAVGAFCDFVCHLVGDSLKRTLGDFAQRAFAAALAACLR